MQHISESLATQAWEQYEQASAAAARYLSGWLVDIAKLCSVSRHD